MTRTDYKVNEVELYYDNLPSVFDGYRVAFISDIHTGSMVDAVDEFGDVVEIINSLNVDAAFLGGDIINIHHSEIDSSFLACCLASVCLCFKCWAASSSSAAHYWVNVCIRKPDFVNRFLHKHKCRTSFIIIFIIRYHSTSIGRKATATKICKNI